MTSLLLLDLLLLWSICLSTCSAGPGDLPSLSPQHVRFNSLDYKNVLKWDPPAGSSSDLHYHVQWKIYGEKQWRDVDGCQSIGRLTCDLSQVTSEPREWYYAQVSVSKPGSQSAWVLSPRFNPSWETSVSSPILRLSVKEQGIVVRLRPPRSPLRRANGKRISMARLQRLTYKVYLIPPNGKEEVFEVEGCSKQLMIPNLSPRTRYCLQAQSIQPLLRQSSPRGNAHCVSTH
ncbi:interleukin-22 receptor subunit alpha-2 isoform X2 [Hypomesus transpacificus]|uniref:interleukin-22 receptor subunit alpha-2 isoform X2 n=1 Tax=Hypomesus transpacificus TaxID=137520 RepID=UPI001F078B45|nr:interleukin-22 receptor subunit alpha-2 isoform X2 [Hypomesus transpacificus]